jgi:hypothetical protein
MEPAATRRERLKLEKNRLQSERDACDRELKNLESKWSQWQAPLKSDNNNNTTPRIALYSNQTMKHFPQTPFKNNLAFGIQSSEYEESEEQEERR